MCVNESRRSRGAKGTGHVAPQETETTTCRATTCSVFCHHVLHCCACRPRNSLSSMSSFHAPARRRQLEDQYDSDSPATSRSASVALRSEPGIPRRQSISSLATSNTRADSPLGSRGHLKSGLGDLHVKKSRYRRVSGPMSIVISMITRSIELTVQ